MLDICHLSKRENNLAGRRIYGIYGSVALRERGVCSVCVYLVIITVYSLQADRTVSLGLILTGAERQRNKCGGSAVCSIVTDLIK